MMWRIAKRTAFVLALGLWFAFDIAEARSRKLAGWLEDNL
jgi:hypothetical protein